MIFLKTILILFLITCNPLILLSATANPPGGRDRCDPVCCAFVTTGYIPLCIEKTITTYWHCRKDLRCSSGYYATDEHPGSFEDYQASYATFNCGFGSGSKLSCVPTKNAGFTGNLANACWIYDPPLIVSDLTGECCLSQDCDRVGCFDSVTGGRIRMNVTILSAECQTSNIP